MNVIHCREEDKKQDNRKEEIAAFSIEVAVLHR